MIPGATLRGKHILVARPAGQATALADAIAQRGGTSLLFASIEIHPIALSPASRAALAALASCYCAIFISANAVEQGLRHVTAWPPHLPALAVGEATASALARSGITQILTPTDGADTDALLRLPALTQVAQRRIVIFRGRGGRELLAQTLRQRGAQVDYVESYERRIPMTDPAPLLHACDNAALHAVCINSSEALDNLFTLAGTHGAACLRRIPLFVSHPRQAQHASALGVNQVVVCAPGEASLVAALETHLATIEPGSEPAGPA